MTRRDCRPASPEERATGLASERRSPSPYPLGRGTAMGGRLNCWQCIGASPALGLSRESPGGRCHQTPILVLAHQARNRAASFLETGKVPEVWKIAALLRLDRLNRAIIAVQENT